MMNPQIQSFFAYALLGIVCVWMFVKFGKTLLRKQLYPRLAKYYLKKGQVPLAMKYRLKSEYQSCCH